MRIHGLTHDVRFAATVLARQPFFTVAAVLLLALGIGVNAALYNAAHATYFTRLPYPEADRLVELRTRRIVPTVIDSKFHSRPASELIQSATSSLEPVGRYALALLALTGSGTAQELSGQYVSPEWFAVLRTSPILGRTFNADDLEHERHDVVVLSHRLWQQTFAGASDIIGRQISLAAQPTAVFMPFAPKPRSYPVIGVMPPPEMFSAEGALWLPLTPELTRSPKPPSSTSMEPRRLPRILGAIGRLAPDVPLARANAELATMATALVREYPDTERGWNIRAVTLQDTVNERYRTTVFLLLAAAMLVLALACVSISGLVIARNSERQKDFAIRTVLGASRGVLMRHAICEGLLIAILGGVCGLLGAGWVTGAFRRPAPAGTPGLEDVLMNPVTIAYVLVLSITAGIIIGIVSGRQVATGELSPALKSSGSPEDGPKPWSFRARGLMIGFQIATIVPLAVASLLMLKTLANLTRVDLGYQRDGVVAATVTFSSTTCANLQECQAAVGYSLPAYRATKIDPLAVMRHE